MKTISKIVGAGLAIAMALGIGVAASYSGKDVIKAEAATSTYQHVFNAKPSTGSGITLSTVSWTVSATNLNGYNRSNYAGVQFGSSKSNGQITLTSTNAWGEQTGTTYYGKKVISEIRLWLNLGGTSVTPSVTIGGTAAISDGTTVVKNSSAGSDWTKTTCVTFTPATNHNTGVVVVDVTSVKAGYICCLEIDSDETAPATKTLDHIDVSGSMTKTSYRTTDSWDPSGLVVTATYDDTTTKVVTSSAEWTYNPADPSSTSTTSVVATASYTENEVTKSASSSAQSVTVTDKGTPANPYTVAEARAAIDAGEGITGVYATGIVSEIVTPYSSQYENISFNMSSDGTTTSNQLQAFRATGSEAENITVGDIVIISGNLKKWGSTYEFDSGCVIESRIAPASVTSIAVKTAPTKTAYKSGEAFDATGLVITATYSDSSTQDILYDDNTGAFSFSPSVITASGNITITYREQTCTQAVTLITVVDVIGVASAPSEVYQNATISVSDVVLNVTYSDSSTDTVTPDSVTCDTSTLGTATATATYNAASGIKTATFDVTVKKEPVYDIIVDELTVEDTGISGTTYGSWSGVTKLSGAVYAGSTNENDSGGIGMRQNTSKDPSGIIVTSSQGIATKVQITWTTTTDRTIHIKGQNTPYTNIEHAASVTGTEVGTITYSSTSVDLNSEYNYICIYVTGGAAGMSSIKITWKVPGASNPLTDNPVLSTGASAEVYAGKNLALTVTTTPVDSDEKLIVTSSNTDYVTVSGSDRTYTIHGVAIGSATVTVKGAKGVYQSSVVISVVAATKTFEDKIMTPDDLGITSYDTSDTTYSFDGADYTVKQVMKQSGFQFKKEAGYLYNTEALYASNNIKTITLIMYGSNANEPSVYESSSAGDKTTLLSPKTAFNATGVNTYEFSGSTPFFRIDASTSGAVNISKIIIELEDSASTVLSHARSAANVILNALKNTCGAGNSGVVTQSQWDALNDSLTALNLTADDKQFLKDATRLSLDDLSQGGATIENAMGHYDYCVTKFGFAPFTGISEAQGTAHALQNMINIDEATSVTVIITVALVALTSVGGYFFLKRRKETI